MDKTIEKIKKIGTNNWINQTLNAKTKIKKLMKKYATAYYEGKALISDWDFDVLIDCLKELDINDDYLKTPGWGYSVKKGINHLYCKIGTVPYLYDYEKLKDIFNDDSNLVIMPKFDGVNFVAYFSESKLNACATRGNGYLGKDITKKFSTSAFKILNDLKTKSFAISGEVISLSSKSKSQARNDVAKMINSKFVSKKKLNKFLFVPFSLINYTQHSYENEIELLQELSGIKISYLKFDKLPSESELLSIFNEFEKQYVIDGLVITNKTKTKQYAFKYKQGDIL